MDKEFKKIFVGAFDEHCHSGLYTPKYHVLDHMVENMRKLGTISVMDSSLYEYSHVRIMQFYEKSFTEKMNKNNENGRRDEEMLREVSAIRKEKV